MLSAGQATSGLLDLPFSGPSPLFSTSFLTLTLALLFALPLLRADFRVVRGREVRAVEAGGPLAEPRS